MFDYKGSFNFEGAYKELLEVWQYPICQKALRFASQNPDLVYGMYSDESREVKNGYFDAYFSKK